MTKDEIDGILWTAKGNAQGSTVAAAPDEIRELQEIGLLGRSKGLTRKGSIARERMVNAAQDKAFG